MFTPILNQSFKIIISTILTLGITQILLVLIARFVASKKHWSKPKATLIAELVWMLLRSDVNSGHQTFQAANWPA